MSQDLIMQRLKKQRVSLAKELGVTRQAIEQWTKVPPERCLEVERITGISRHELRPDIYGPVPGPFQAASNQAAA